MVNPCWNVTRYEHSVGVMLLIRRLGGSLEEQIAGLLHDISHTAFSHVVDVTLKQLAEDYHEQIYHQVLMESDIPEILNRHGFNHENILLKEAAWTILEQPAPHLCADRVDYTLRDMYHYHFITKQDVDAFLSHLIMKNGQMVVTEITAAEWFTQTYYLEVIGFFLHPLNVYGYEFLSQALSLALDKSIISTEDLLRTDGEVLTLLKNSADPQLQRLLQAIHPNVIVAEDQRHYDFHLKKKVRLIDPTVYANNEFIPASQLSGKIKTMSDQACLKAQEGVYVKIISS